MLFAYVKTKAQISAFVFPIALLAKSGIPLAIFCGCTAQFVSDLVGNPEDRFCRDMAHNIKQ